MFQGTRSFSYEQFEFLEELGRGAFGVVYKAFDRIAKLDVAIKQIDLESTDEITEIQQEIAILAACNNKNVTRYYGSFLKGSKLLIVMEYLGGGSCSDLLAAGPFDESAIALICHELLLALTYLHDTGKIHRDIKAANVLIGGDGSVKIADFGVATQLSNNLSKRNTFVGTPYWMSPEIILHHEYSTSADIWSLGITAMEFAFGKPPLSQFHPFDVLFKIADDPPPTPGANFSESFNSFVTDCLQKDPKFRPKAKALLNHKFIRQRAKIGKETLIKLIQKKKQWDIDIGNDGEKNVYITTETQLTAPVQFDLDTVKQTFNEQKTDTIMDYRRHSTPNRQLDSSLNKTIDNSTYEQRRNMRKDLNRILNQSFNKIASKNNLTTLQYDGLVNFQSIVFNYLLDGDDEKFNEYFSSFLKLTNQGIMKSNNRLLKEKVFPKSYFEMETKATKNADHEKGTKLRQRDDIEELLLSRWAEGVIEKWG